MDDLISRKEAIKAIRCGHLSAATIYGRSDEGMMVLAESIRAINSLPSAQPELTENWWKTDHGYMWLCPHCGLPVHSDFEECLRCGIKRPSAQPELDEWCDDCSEYDKKRHCCPRWNRVIKKTLEEAQTKAHWIPCKERLPEEEDMYQPPKHRYLCQLRRRDMMLVLARLRNIGSPMAAFWDWYGKNVPDKDVIAWLPLPEPYEEGKE